MINWFSSAARAVTDFTVGSVIRTLFESVAREIEEIYYRLYTGLTTAQEEGVYAAFDFPRKSAVRASGTVTFYRMSADPTKDYSFGVGTRVYASLSAGKTSFETTENASILTKTGLSDVITFSSDSVDGFGNIYTSLTQRFVSSVTSIVVGATTYIQGPSDDYVLYKDPDSIQDKIKWNVSGNHPSVGESMIITYFPLSVDVQVIALGAGTSGNVATGLIDTISTPISGVEYIKNFSSFLNGADPETSEERKLRFSKYIDGLSRGTIASVYYAIFNKTETYPVYTATILENQPTSGFLTIYVGDSSGVASQALKDDVLQAVEQYRGVGITVAIKSPTVVTVDVACRLSIDPAYIGLQTSILSAIQTSLETHLSSYRLLDDPNGVSSVYLSNLSYVIKSVYPQAISDIDISFKKSIDTIWDTQTDPFTPVTIDDLTPQLTASVAEIFRPGTVTVSMK
jgi:hypothetical protein